ncbi:MAG: NADH-quinone oxidoreductase subunit C [Candidatus Omnitrophica bacterium]|nr:NADH-quinone oxidoreductase subunit C [Candidatus Omnitrophota bacterium]
MDMREKIKEKLGDKIIEWFESSSKRIYLNIDKKDVFKVTEVLFKDLGLRFITASASDMPEGFEILYHFSNDPAGEVYSMRVLLKDKNKPMLGINFKGHPNLKKLLLAEDWPKDNYPLRNK